MQDFLTVSQVAYELHLSKGTVRSYIKSGKLRASKPNGRNFIIMRTELMRLLSGTEYEPIATL